MESTKRFAITFVTMVAWMTLPATADDEPKANTGVELNEYRDTPTTYDDQQFVDAETGEVRYAINQIDDTQFDANDNHEADGLGAEEGGEFVAEPVDAGVGEEALIPRRNADEDAGEIVRAGQVSVPWYRSPFAALMVVLGVIGAVAASVRRWVPAARTVTSDQLCVVGRTAISSKQSAVLLHVGKRIVLVGVTPDRVNTLSEITDESEVAQLIGRAKSEESKSKGFDGATLGSELSGSGDFDSALAREIEQYDDVEVSTAQAEVEASVAPTKADQTDAPQPEATVVAAEPAPASGTKSNGQPPKHLNDLLARLRSFQKS
ncbi:MAG: hypothetical protein DHS20C16_18920 [Phycisphaerae bacterium]|nr:MAG: hypothetical protein DHS20C16_18920 [Phycisphaerae bacterium]